MGFLPIHFIALAPCFSISAPGMNSKQRSSTSDRSFSTTFGFAFNKSHIPEMYILLEVCGLS